MFDIPVHIGPLKDDEHVQFPGLVHKPLTQPGEQTAKNTNI
jgi:hypothetical protein